MKFSVAIVCLIIVVSVNGLSDDQRKRAQEHVAKCKAEVGLETGVASKLRSGNFTDSSYDHKAKCFVECFFKETGFMDKKGEPQRDVIISKLISRHGLDRDLVTELVDRCIKEKGNDNCETAYKIFQCYRQNRAVRNKIQSYTTVSLGGSTTPSGTSTKASSAAGGSSTTPTTPHSGIHAGSSSTTPVSSTTKASNVIPTTSFSWFGK